MPYVDDLLVGCERNLQATEIRLALSKHFKIKDLGDDCFVLGIEVKLQSRAWIASHLSVAVF